MTTPRGSRRAGRQPGARAPRGGRARGRRRSPHRPLRLTTPTPRPSSACACTPLRSIASQAKGASSAAREETADLDAELAKCRSVVDRLRSVASGSGKENSGSSREVVALMKRLQPLLTRSDAIREERLLDDAAGRAGSGTAAAQINAQRAQAGSVSADALHTLENLL